LICTALKIATTLSTVAIMTLNDVFAVKIALSHEHHSFCLNDIKLRLTLLEMKSISGYLHGMEKAFASFEAHFLAEFAVVDGREKEGAVEQWISVVDGHMILA
jgi:hypothetical protein